MRRFDCEQLESRTMCDGGFSGSLQLSANFVPGGAPTGYKLIHVDWQVELPPDRRAAVSIYANNTLVCSRAVTVTILETSCEKIVPNARQFNVNGFLRNSQGLIDSAKKVLILPGDVENNDDPDGVDYEMNQNDIDAALALLD